MSEHKVGETKLREQQEMAAEVARARPSSDRSSRHFVWKIVGGAALALAATTLITSWHDIRRYIRIRRM